MERIKTVGTITGVLLLACGILNFTVGMGTIYIGFQQTARILWQIFQGTANGNILADVIYYLRLPRLVLAAVVGYGLSITGCVMQAVMRNSLADPYLLGISSGAGLGAVIAIILGFTSVVGFDAIGCFAFLGAFAVTIFIVLLSLRFGKSGTTAILLSGMALNAVCAAGISRCGTYSKRNLLADGQPADCGLAQYRNFIGCCIFYFVIFCQKFTHSQFNAVG